MLKRSMLIMFTLFTAALVGCDTLTAEQPTATPEAVEPTATPEAVEPTATPEAEEPTPTPEADEPAQLPDGWTLYENEEAGFAIGYPQEWLITQGEAEGITYLTSFDFDDTPDTGGIPPGETKVDILTSQPPRAETVEAFVEDQRENNENIDSEITNVEDLTVLGGTDAVLITSEGRRGTSQTFYTVYNGYGIVMTPFGETGPFPTMLDTLRPLDDMAFPAPDAVLEAVAATLPDTNAEDLTIMSAERVEWSNACLELPEENEVCAEVITPGWRVMVDADGTPVEVHTDENAEQIRIGQ